MKEDGGLRARVAGLSGRLPQGRRARQESALRGAARRYRRIADDQLEMIARWTPEGRLVFANEAYRRMYGLSRGERKVAHLLGRGEDAICEKSARLGAGKSVEVEVCREKRADGTAAWIQWSDHAILDDDCRPVEIQSVGVDVTELRELDERYHRTLDNMLETCLIIGFDWRIIYVNFAFMKLVGLPRKKLLGFDFWQVFSELDGTGFASAMRRAMKDRTPESQAHEYILPGGSRWCETSIQPVPEGIFMLSLDVTERRRIEESLRRSEARYRLLAENVSDVIWTMDQDLRLTYVSPSVERMLGCSPKEAMGKGLEAVLAPGSRRRAQFELKAALEGRGSGQAVQLQMLRSDGSAIWTETSANAVRDEPGRPVSIVGVTRNIEQRKRLEQDIFQWQKLDAIGRVTGELAHDFKNMMMVVVGYAERADRQLRPDNPLRSHLEAIKAAGSRAMDLSKALLTFSRKEPIRTEAIAVNEVISDLLPMLQRLLGEDIVLLADLSEEVGCVETDRKQLEQAVMNLAVNARDALPSGGAVVISTANVSLDEYAAGPKPALQSGDYVVINVADDGVGMDEETRQRVFEPFFTTKPAGEGTGLGLATVYGLVTQSGGDVWIDSERDVGTTVTMFLPQYSPSGRQPAEENAKPSGLEVPPEPEPEPEGAETILLLEDEENIRELIRFELEDRGYRVLTAGNGDEALAACSIAECRINLLVSDVILPGKSGRKVYESLLESIPDLKVLYMSGHTESHIVRHGVLEEGIAFIEKPFTPEALARKVREVLDSRQPVGKP